MTKTKSFLETKKEEMEHQFQLLEKNESAVSIEELNTRYATAYKKLKEKVIKSVIMYLFARVTENLFYDANKTEMVEFFNSFVSVNGETIKKAALKRNESAIEQLAEKGWELCLDVWAKKEGVLACKRA